MRKRMSLFRDPRIGTVNRPLILLEDPEEENIWGDKREKKTRDDNLVKVSWTKGLFKACSKGSCP